MSRFAPISSPFTCVREVCMPPQALYWHALATTPRKSAARHRKTATVQHSVCPWGALGIYALESWLTQKHKHPIYFGSKEKSDSASIKRWSWPWLQSLPCLAPSCWPDGPGFNLREAAAVTGPHTGLPAGQAVRMLFRYNSPSVRVRPTGKTASAPCGPCVWRQPSNPHSRCVCHSKRGAR